MGIIFWFPSTSFKFLIQNYNNTSFVSEAARYLKAAVSRLFVVESEAQAQGVWPGDTLQHPGGSVVRGIVGSPKEVSLLRGIRHEADHEGSHLGWKKT